MIQTIKGKQYKEIGIYFLLVYVFLLMFIAFTVHGAYSEVGKKQHPEFLNLTKSALSKGDIERASSFERAANDIEWSLQDNFTVYEAFKVGSIAGSLIVPVTYGIYRLVRRLSQTRIGPDIGSSSLFAICSILAACFLLIYEGVAYWLHPDLYLFPWDGSVVAFFSILVSAILYLYIMLRRRLEMFRQLGSDHAGDDNYLKHIDIENKTWTQVFQSLVFVLVVAFGSIYLSVALGIYDINILWESKHNMTLLAYYACTIALVLFGIIFGLLGRVLWYLGKLVEP